MEERSGCFPAIFGWVFTVGDYGRTNVIPPVCHLLLVLLFLTLCVKGLDRPQVRTLFRSSSSLSTLPRTPFLSSEDEAYVASLHPLAFE